jgi:hypothetical protein
MNARFPALALVFAISTAAFADDSKPATALSEKEQAFANLLQDAVLVGNFTVNREQPGKESARQSPERYGIKSVTKVSGDSWTINSQIKYGQLDVTVPVPVQVHFADDTPVISVTDLSIPLVGDEFTARVMFFDNQYAGTWRHGKVGGLMYGRIEKSQPAETKTDSDATPSPDSSKKADEKTRSEPSSNLKKPTSR